jgi:hypothetical protein
MQVQEEVQIAMDILQKDKSMIYREKTLDIEEKKLLFYSGEVHTSYTHSIFTYFNRRNNGRK